MNKQHITKDVFLSLETKNAILKHAKRKTLDKVSASAL